MAKVFLDTNIVLYAFSEDPRSAVAETLLARGCDLSIQVLNEFANVARRKLGFDWDQIDAALDDIGSLARTIHAIELSTHKRALLLARRYGFSFYDALIVASAIGARCEILYSEDMQDGLAIEGGLRIINPFRHTRPKLDEGRCQALHPPSIL